MATFKCNLPSAVIKTMQFVTGVYTTNDPAEIDYLRKFGMQQGVRVDEVDGKELTAEAEAREKAEKEAPKQAKKAKK